MRWRTALIALLLGLLTTLLVPRVMRWMARNGLLSPAEITFADWQGGEVTRYEETDCTHLYWTSRAVGAWAAMPGAHDLLADVTSGAITFAQVQSGLAGTSMSLPPSGAVLRGEVQIIAQGFPFRCTWGWTRTLAPVVPGPGAPAAAGDEGGIINLTMGRQGFRLTWRPLWPGLIANTLVYGVLWFGALAYVRFAQRRGRSQRGECTACGYSREGLMLGAPCPECGVMAHVRMRGRVG